MITKLANRGISVVTTQEPTIDWNRLLAELLEQRDREPTSMRCPPVSLTERAASCRADRIARAGLLARIGVERVFDAGSVPQRGGRARSAAMRSSSGGWLMKRR